MQMKTRCHLHLEDSKNRKAGKCQVGLGMQGQPFWRAVKAACDPAILLLGIILKKRRGMRMSTAALFTAVARAGDSLGVHLSRESNQGGHTPGILSKVVGDTCTEKHRGTFAHSVYRDEL